MQEPTCLYKRYIRTLKVTYKLTQTIKMTARFIQSPLNAITRAALSRTSPTRLVSTCQTHLYRTQSHQTTPRSFSSATSKPAPTPAANMPSALVDLAKNRRTIYQLGKKSSVPDSKIEELVNAAILNVPSAFNTQSTRLIVLLHDQHDRLWDIAIESFEGLVKAGKLPQEIWEKQTLPKLLGFKGAYGTVRTLLPRTFDLMFWVSSLKLEVSSPVHG